MEKFVLPKEKDTLFYLRNGHILDKSLAVRFMLFDMGGLARILGSVLKILPKRLTDNVYDLVALNRYRLLGKKNVCEISSQKYIDHIVTQCQ